MATIHFNTSAAVTIGRTVYTVDGITRDAGAPLVHCLRANGLRLTQVAVAAREGVKLAEVRRLAAMAIQSAANVAVA